MAIKRNLLLFVLLCLPFLSVRGESPSEQVVRDVTVDEAAKLIEENPALFILDVRTPDEFADGRIPGGTLLDFHRSDFNEALAKLDREKTYLLHCASGFRSTKAMKRMKKLGFLRVYHLDTGYQGWQGAGRPIEQ